MNSVHHVESGGGGFITPTGRDNMHKYKQPLIHYKSWREWWGMKTMEPMNSPVKLRAGKQMNCLAPVISDADTRTMIASTHDVAKGGRAPKSTQNVCNDHDGTAKLDTFDLII